MFSAIQQQHKGIIGGGAAFKHLKQSRVIFVLGQLLVVYLSTCYTAAQTEGNLFFKNSPQEDTSVPLGGILELECEAAGSPSPTVHWLLNGRRLPQTENIVDEDEGSEYENSARNRQIVTLNLGSTRSKLVIDCVTPEDEGEYSCVADVPKNRIASSSFVSVEYKTPMGHMVSSCMSKRKGGVATPAHIFMWTSQRLEVEGADVQLFCRATGYPKPEVSWQDRDGNTLDKSSDRYQVLPNGDLMIRSIDFMTNMGMYKCVARNSVGQDIQGAFLYPTSLGFD